jgi:RNA polymerase sigma-70 factor (ECF subfamily)
MVISDDQLQQTERPADPSPSIEVRGLPASPCRQPEKALPIDQNLLSLACSGNCEAFTELTTPLRGSLLRQAVALAGDVSLAEDLVSETLVEAWKCLSRYNHTCRLSTWLYAILLHRHHSAIRRARSRPISLAWLPWFEARHWENRQPNLPASDFSPAETLAQNETTVRVRQWVDRLPQKHRQVILLRFFEDASLTDMASVLGCSLGTVKSRLHHALEKLRKMKMNLADLTGDKQS